MIEYAKSILPKIRDWETLFRKELIKCYSWVPKNEIPELRNWCYANFYGSHQAILAEVFNPSPKVITLQLNRSKKTEKPVRREIKLAEKTTTNSMILCK